MALTVGIRADGFTPIPFFPLQRVTLTPGSADYAAGGYALSGSQANGASAGGPANNGLHGVIFEGGNTAAEGYVPFYNEQTGKFQLFVTGTASGDALNELANGANPAGAVWYAIFELVGE